MSVEFTEEWLREYCARTGKAMPGIGGEAESKRPSRSKYNNKPVEADGARYDSKHEANTAAELMAEGRTGKIAGLAKQVVFFLPGGVKYIADFVVFKKDGSFEVIDAKSPATKKDKVYRLKKRQMRECLGLEIKEV